MDELRGRISERVRVETLGEGRHDYVGQLMELDPTGVQLTVTGDDRMTLVMRFIPWSNVEYGKEVSSSREKRVMAGSLSARYCGAGFAPAISHAICVIPTRLTISLPLTQEIGLPRVIRVIRLNSWATCLVSEDNACHTNGIISPRFNSAGLNARLCIVRGVATHASGAHQCLGQTRRNRSGACVRRA